MLSEFFWTFLVGASIAFVYNIMKMLYKSKCKSFKLCCLEINRDTLGEETLDSTDLGTSSSDTMS